MTLAERNIPGCVRRQQGLTLVEVLVSMVILSIVSTMLIVIWVALQDSYAYSVDSATARETARDVMSRMRREIRDAQSGPDSQNPITVAAADHIQIYTPFNDAEGDVQRVDYWYRSTSTTTGYISRSRNGGAETIVATNIANVAKDAPLFTYGYVDSSGVEQTASSVSGSLTPLILTIEIRIIADVNPAKAPAFMDLVSTVQLRNQRQF